MKIVLLITLSFLLGACATRTRGTEALVKDRGDLPKQWKIADVPFIKQEKNHCGPASLAMVMKQANLHVDLKELTQQTMTTSMEGTFQSEMLSAARRQGLMTILVSDFKSILQEIENDHPVIVFQNLGFSFKPQWHYAVAIGFDLNGPDIYLPNDKQDMRMFERSWILGGQWALVILKPDQLSATASEMTHLKAAAQLESMGMLNEAQMAYETIMTKWKQSLGALIGLGNVMYARKDYKKSKHFLELAVSHHPQSEIARHNLKEVSLKVK